MQARSQIGVLHRARRQDVAASVAVRRIATIGVYEFDPAGFVAALDEAGVTKLLDIRQRRGVRGARYAWANSNRLQALLSAARIRYEHHPELAPDTELRELQYREDAREGVGKRSRVRLAPEYVRRYTEEILDLAPLGPLVDQLPVHGIAALMCVEATADACHRSLVADRLAQRYGFEVVHLEPDSVRAPGSGGPGASVLID
ncbi:MAG: DUF488 family protein, N3 subclade [Solirubrobacteraceae bacterium]